MKTTFPFFGEYLDILINFDYADSMTEEEQALGRIYKTVTPAATQTVQSGAARKPASDAGKTIASVASVDAPIFDQEPSSSKNASVWMVLVTFAIIAIPTISVWIAVFAKQR